ncbi:MAG TPA: serine/threonine-protein kinase [Gemmataceae bacterium]|nr:serine/threonine-protein kinase [Gemmataceae bacterium]
MSSPTPDSRSELLAHLRADQSQRWQRGERVTVEYYLARHPELSADPGAVVELIRSEMLRRRQAGERPTLDEYVTRFPAHAAALRRAWPALAAPPTKSWADSGAGRTTVAESGPPDAAPPPPAAPALRLPGLELLDTLGEGGMGVVYRARDVRLDQPRAVKVIRHGSFGRAEARDRFNREARAVARLDHPGVVRIYQLGEHEGTLYICMECVEGGNLQARLRDGPLDVRDAAELVRGLALAVQHAHDNHVLHRDLKPGNVLLQEAPQGLQSLGLGAPKITDFGLAKLLDADDDLTQAGAVLGTPSYMAPEQAEGRASEVREWTDVWALGAILYECLTGRPPFKCDTRSETLEQVRRAAPAPPRRLRPEVPVELERVCLACLEKDPARRCPSASALAGALRDWLDGRTVVLPRARRPKWRRRVAAGLAALLAVAVATGLYILPPRERPEPPPEPPAAAKPAPPGPGEWQDLLAREPTPLRWPERMKKREIHYEPSSHTLRVAASDLGLVGLGEATATRWRLAVRLSQTPWTGNVGLFFGYRVAEDGDAPAVHYQMVWLVNQGEAPGRDPFRLDWADQLHRDPPREQYIGRTVSSSRGFRLAPGDHRLELAFGPDGLESVRLDDEAEPRLGRGAGNVNNPPPGAECRGKFGIVVRNGNGDFSEFQYLYSEESR